MYHPSQLTEQHLQYYYDCAQIAQGKYYNLKPGLVAPPGFPSSFWEQERYDSINCDLSYAKLTCVLAKPMA